MLFKIPSCPHSSWGQRCNWDSPRELVRIYTHTGWPRLLTQSYKICKKRSQSHLFSLSLSLCQTMDPLLQSFQLCPLGPVSLSLLSSSRSRSFMTKLFFGNIFVQQAATGVSGILRWRIGTSDTILSLMVSVPYRLTGICEWES